MTETRPQRLHPRNQALYGALKDAGIIRENDYVRRVIIDIDSAAGVVIHIERYGDERLLGLIRTLDGAEIRTGTPEPEPDPGTVALTAGDVRLLRERLIFDGPPPRADDTVLDSKLYRLQAELEGREQQA